MTIHGAKGLEFKVVIVADTGRQKPAPADILCLSDGRFGFKVAHPATGSRVDTATYKDVRESREQAEREERLRLYYVAMTRAMERLIVSGSIDPAKTGGEQTPIAWVLDRLGLTEAVADSPATPVEVERGAAAVVLRVDRGEAPSEDVRRGSSQGPARIAAPEADGEPGQLALFEGMGESLPPLAPRLRELPDIPDPPLHRVGRLSYSAISLFSRCSYRYFAERVVGLKPAAWAASDGPGGLHPTEIGDAVHRLLELVELDSPAVPADLEALVSGWYPGAQADELRRIRRDVEAYCASPLASRLADLGGCGGGAAVRLRARRRAAERTTRRPSARRRPRRSFSTTRRTRSTVPHPSRSSSVTTASSASSTPLRASTPAPNRSRSSTSSSSGRTMSCQ